MDSYKTNTEGKMKDKDSKSEYEYKYKADYEADWDVHSNYVQSFDAYEAMLIGQVYDSVSNSVDGSKITDSYAMTLAKERADRVIAKLPDGVVEPVGKADVGKAAFMDILRQKWIYPNANAQHSFLEKLNMWQLYSSVYGYMPMFYDWRINTSTGYVGPDCWLWNPRNLIPQQGRTSIEDMEYLTALTWVNRSYLQNILDSEDEEGGWNKEAIREVLDRQEVEAGQDYQKDTKVSRDRNMSTVKKGICLATRHEAGQDGKWITFAPDHGCVELRNIKNPHKNGRIPFVVKYGQPLFDSFYGLGDFQRAKPLQFARDGLINFYFKGIKMNLVPPIVANANGVIKHTLDYREGGVMFETIPNSIRRLETSNAGLSTYQAAQTNLTGSLLSMFGSQNASMPGAETLNPEQGKTPAAISLYNDKEATRDGAERRHLEDAIQKLNDGFFTMVANIGTEDIPVTLFAEDIKDIVKSGLGDLTELFENLTPNETETAGELRIKPSALKGIEYRFIIEPDSTAKINQQQQLGSLLDMMDKIGKYQNILQEDPRITIHWDKIMSTYQSLSNIPGASEFISFDPEKQKEPEQPSVTTVQLPNGQLMDATDVVKLYASSEDPMVKAQILQVFGFQASPVTEPVVDPTVTSSGFTLRDPQLASVAEALNASIQPTPGGTIPQ